ncbi:hypothetical protein FNV43_RR24516 [Rhamnella rubrinervis]|uniref:DUF1985 domain-containing protein n=1 Tax=Rhamnella rubrinervis TaxID=2594499 RepID=A0A8K0DSP5_9ROSA|nr:hypothetical protein FNV43_RR24516 [Rhamnella rubrinervis]
MPYFFILIAVAVADAVPPPSCTPTKEIILSGGIVHNMLVRQTDSISEDVMEFNFNGKGTIFTKREFGFITGLKMENSVDVPPLPQSNRIRNTYFDHLKKTKNLNARDVFLGLKRTRLEDKDDMFKWVSLGIPGLGYETIPLMRELYATKVDNSFPRICNWKATNLPVFKSVGKTLFDNAELYVIERLRLSNVKEESIYPTNEDYPIPPIPPPKNYKRHRKKAIDTENAEIAYYQQQDVSNHEGHSFENEYDRPNTYENIAINEDPPEGEIRDEETNVMQNDNEIQFISSSKVIQQEPRIKKRAGKLKSPFIVTTET